MYKKLSHYAAENEWVRPVIVLIVIFICCIIFSPVSYKGNNIFLKPENLANIMRQLSEIGIIAVGMTLVILTGGIDLSVGSVLALSAVITAFGFMDWRFGFFTTLFLSLLSGALAGLINGLVISRWKIQSFVVTLAMMTIARGVALRISGMSSRNLGFGENAAPESFKLINATLLGIPFPVYIFLFVVLIFTVVMAKMRTGRYIIVIGSNAEAARLAGIPVKRTQTFAFVCCGTLAALAGFIHTGQLYQGNPNDGIGYELDAIAAAVIGGTSLSGGKGTVTGTLAGVLIIGLLNNIFGLHGMQKDFQFILKGVIIIIAVLLQGRKPVA
jgi:ribose transport system permease protein